MASQERADAPSVAEELFRESYRFDFDQAVRLLEQLFPGTAPLGSTGDPRREAVRIRNDMGLAFPPSPVLRVRPGPGEKSRFAEMLVTFLGVAGVMGPLPLSFTELLMERDRKRDYAMRDFLDIFNHRIVSLLHRVHTAGRLRLQRGTPEQQPHGRFLMSLAGLGTPGTQGRMPVRDAALLFYSGLLSKRPAPVSGLSSMLGDYFDTHVEVVPLRGRWCRLDDDQRTKIGFRGQANQLGHDALLGSRFWDQEAAFDLKIGPMKLKLLQDFLPGGKAFKVLVELTRLYVGPTYAFGLQLVLQPDEVPQARLGRTEGSRLGWTSWLGRYDTRGGNATISVQEHPALDGR